MRAPAKLGIALTVVVAASCSGSDAPPPRDAAHHLMTSDKSAAPVAISPLESGQSAAGRTAKSRKAVGIKAGALDVAHAAPMTMPTATPAGVEKNVSPIPTEQVAPAPEAAPAATTAPLAATPSDAAATPSKGERNAGDGGSIDDGRRTEPGIVIIRGGPGSGLDPCDIDHPTKPGGVLINTRVPNMGGPLSTPAGGTGSMPGMGGGVVVRGGGTTRGGGFGGGGFGGGRTHH